MSGGVKAARAGHGNGNRGWMPGGRHGMARHWNHRCRARWRPTLVWRDAPGTRMNTDGAERFDGCRDVPLTFRLLARRGRAVRRGLCGWNRRPEGANGGARPDAAPERGAVRAAGRARQGPTLVGRSRARRALSLRHFLWRSEKVPTQSKGELAIPWSSPPMHCSIGSVGLGRLSFSCVAGHRRIEEARSRIAREHSQAPGRSVLCLSSR
jgi:hypothetical protein